MNDIKSDFLFFKVIKKYAVIPILVSIIINAILYVGSNMFILHYFHFKQMSVITVIDKYIPIISFFIIPYCFYYIYLWLGPFFISFLNKKMFFHYIIAFIVGLTLGTCFFIIYPTCVIRDTFVVKNIFDELLYFIHKTDITGNACPSFHCFTSWLICVVIRKNNQYVSKYTIIKIFFLSTLICVSTVLTKQHGFIDILGGVFLAEISWFLTNNESLINSTENFFTYLNKKLHICC